MPVRACRTGKEHYKYNEKDNLYIIKFKFNICIYLTSTACSSETKEAEYTVYFTNSQGTALIEDKVNVDENDSHSLAVRLLEIMDTKSGKDNSVIKPSRVNSPDIEFDAYMSMFILTAHIMT